MLSGLLNHLPSFSYYLTYGVAWSPAASFYRVSLVPSQSSPSLFTRRSQFLVLTEKSIPIRLPSKIKPPLTDRGLGTARQRHPLRTVIEDERYGSDTTFAQRLLAHTDKAQEFKNWISKRQDSTMSYLREVQGPLSAFASKLHLKVKITEWNLRTDILPH